MKPKKNNLLLLIFISLQINLFAWTSSNEGVCYSLDSLSTISDSVYYSENEDLFISFCHLNILENDTLMISEGERLKFLMNLQPGNYIFYGINIYGTLLAIGNANNPITIGDPESSWSSGEVWGGIKFFGNSNNFVSKLSYCYLLRAKEFQLMYESAIYCENSSPLIDNCTFQYLGSGEEYGGCSAISLAGQSYPIIKNCEFKNIYNGVAVWCNPFNIQDTVNYPSPLLIGCNIRESVTGFYGYGCDYDIAILNGGFLSNCYLGVPNSSIPDTTLGFPVDTLGDGICTTTSNYIGKKRFLNVDGVVNPRGDTLITGFNSFQKEDDHINIEDISLYHCNPNPFTDFTTINFELKSLFTNITILIIDNTGRVINEICITKSFKAGMHSLKWFGCDKSGLRVQNGIYHCVIFYENKYLSKKLVLTN